MRTAVLLAREHNNKAFDLLLGPEAGIQAALNEFKSLRGAGKTHERFADVHLYLSDEGLKKIKFQPPASESEPVGDSPTDEEKARLEAEAKAKADQEAADKAATEEAADKAATEEAAAKAAEAEKARIEAEKKAKAEAEKARIEAEKKAKAEAEKARIEAEKKAKAEAEKKAKAEAKAKAAAAK